MPDPVSRASDPGQDAGISRELLAETDEAATSREHWKILLTAGMGFFTDAYDLFIIGVAPVPARSPEAPGKGPRDELRRS